jgi:hypothetical protein
MQMARFGIAALAVGGLVQVGTPVMATSPIAEVLCEPTAKMTRRLTRSFGVEPRSWGTRGPEQVMQVWTSDSGNWAMVTAYATGTSCIVAMGENWDSVEDGDPA